MGIRLSHLAADSPNSKFAFSSSRSLIISKEGKFCRGIRLAKDNGGKGEYAVIGNPGQANHDNRISSFIWARMEEKWPNMKLVLHALLSNTDCEPKLNNALNTIAQATP